LLHLQEICSEMPPFAAETLGFSFPEQQIPQRVCSKNLLQSHCRSVANLLIICTAIDPCSSMMGSKADRQPHPL
jgi:hypothetical protein